MAKYKDLKIGFKDYFRYLLMTQNPKYIFRPKDYKIKESKKTFYIDLSIKTTFFFILLRILESNNYFNIRSIPLVYLLLCISVLIIYSLSEILHWFYVKFDIFEIQLNDNN